MNNTNMQNGDWGFEEKMHGTTLYGLIKGNYDVKPLNTVDLENEKIDNLFTELTGLKFEELNDTILRAKNKIENDFEKKGIFLPEEKEDQRALLLSDYKTFVLGRLLYCKEKIKTEIYSELEYRIAWLLLVLDLNLNENNKKHNQEVQKETKNKVSGIMAA